MWADRTFGIRKVSRVGFSKDREGKTIENKSQVVSCNQSARDNSSQKRGS